MIENKTPEPSRRDVLATADAAPLEIFAAAQCRLRQAEVDQLPDELVVRAESFYRDNCGTLNQSS